jgi:lambda repressor-like predicted transcriptional regulator
MNTKIMTLLRQQGKSLQWLSEQCGYTTDQLEDIIAGNDDHLKWDDKTRIAEPLGTTALKLFHMI